MTQAQICAQRTSGTVAKARGRVRHQRLWGLERSVGFFPIELYAKNRAMKPVPRVEITFSRKIVSVQTWVCEACEDQRRE